MAYTGCDCGVGLWDGYVPSGVNWDIFPKWQAEAAISKHPEYGIADVGDYISETYDNDEFIEVWLCRRCRRIQIRDQYIDRMDVEKEIGELFSKHYDEVVYHDHTAEVLSNVIECWSYVKI